MSTFTSFDATHAGTSRKRALMVALIFRHNVDRGLYRREGVDQPFVAVLGQQCAERLFDALGVGQYRAGGCRSLVGRVRSLDESAPVLRRTFGKARFGLQNVDRAGSRDNESGLSAVGATARPSLATPALPAPPMRAEDAGASGALRAAVTLAFGAA